MIKKLLYAIIGVGFCLTGCTGSSHKFTTDYFGVEVNPQGYITGMYDLTKENRNFSPADKPSPLLALYDEDLRRYYYPVKARYSGGKYKLEYENGSVATIKVDTKDKYIRFELEDLTNRENIGGVQWGNYYTNITNLLGEIIGVARDTTESVHYSIGVLALDDNTIGGLSHFTSETGSGGYIVHTPDAERYPLPVSLREGQQFTLGGDGISDVAFYNRREPYFRMLYGNAAGVDESGRIDIRYHSRDRRKGRLIYSPEGVPIQQNNEPNHLMRQDVPGVDYIGSSIALWGSPDSLALMDVIQTIVKDEGLPYPTFQGKWVKDPTTFRPDIITHGSLYDSIASYARQMGIKAVLAYDHPFLHADRSHAGYIDGRDEERKPYHLTSGDLSHREYAAELAKDGIILGRTCITNSLAPGTADGGPLPTDSICIQHRRKLMKPLSATDTIIEIDNPDYMNEVACWEGHCKELNMVKIGKELIHYMGVSDTVPYRLLNVKRGYWGTTATEHQAGDNVDKPQVTVMWAYEGLVPNLELQDEIARNYGDICGRSGLGYYDFDGQEFLFHSGFGTYSAKRFFRNMFDRAKEYGLTQGIRFTGATLSEGSWHYQSIWNVGGGLNIYDVKKRQWGGATSQGKDLRDVTYANFFPSSFGANFPITANSTVEDYEHIEATAVGYGATYGLQLGQMDVESCPQKYAIFNVIRTWEDARSADAFPTHVKKLLQNPALSWRLEEGDKPLTWRLHQMENGKPVRTIELQGKNG